ncbi:MAG: N-acetyltransferase [Bacteroidetes bacterium]|nr:MAG: N-acetyltransferase [Bacteroidota bacterium]TNE97134.1 MAG: N-acetyltransferase [Bacteroidota bacterium]
MIEIRKPLSPKEWDQYYDLRYRVLRKPLGQPVGSERNDGDISGEHFALYDDGHLKAIARLDSAGEGIAQVRFVAVDSSEQGKGYGRLIMEATERKAGVQGNTKMILHARDYAVNFYERLGYKIVEKSHLLFGVLQHYLMEKPL